MGFVEWAVRGMGRLRGTTAGPQHLETGLVGEREAYFFLRRAGYTVVARRWASAKVRGDLDLIAWRGGTLCFVEVKSRTARDKVAAETAVDVSKRRQLRQLANTYLKSFPETERGGIVSRFDVVSVYLLGSKVEVEVMEDAFGWAEGQAERRWSGA